MESKNEGYNPFLLSNFISSYVKMFNELRYNLQALNKRFEFMEKTIHNILKLKTNYPFDEKEEEDLEDKEDIINMDILKEAKIANKQTNKKTKTKIKNKSESNSDLDQNEDALDHVVNDKNLNKFSEFLKIKKEKEENQKKKKEGEIDVIDDFFNELYNFAEDDENENKYLNKKRKNV